MTDANVLITFHNKVWIMGDTWTEKSVEEEYDSRKNVSKW
jgi:hypothetical protein